jgi:hypothetical protein
MIHVAFGQQGAELLPDGLLVMYGGTAGMERLLRIGELRELPE